MRRWLAYALVLMTGLLPLSCSKSSSSSSSNPSVFQTAFLSVIHASEGGNVDLWVESSAIAGGIQFGLATEYLEIEAGNDRLIQLFEAGTTRLVAVINPDLDPLKRYTLIIVGDFANPEVIFIEDDLEQADDDELEIRAVHAAQAAGNIDIYITSPSTDVADVDPTLADVTFQAFTGFGSLFKGNYRIQVTEAGEETVLFDSGAIGLFEDTNITLIILPASSGNRPLMMTLVDANQGFPAVQFMDVRSRIRLLHAISDNENLQLLIDSSLRVSGLGFGASSGHLDFRSGDDTDFAVRQVSGSLPLVEETLDIPALTDRTWIVTNSLADPMSLWLIDDPAVVNANKAQLRLVHSASLAGLIDVYLTAPSVTDLNPLDPDFENMDFLDVIEHLTVDAGEIAVQITQAGQKLALIKESITLAAGDAVTAVGFDPPPGMAVPFTLDFYSDRP